MSKEIFLISDTHFGHGNILTFKDKSGQPIRPYKTLEEMDEALIDNWNKVVKPTDKIYHLGDVAIPRKGFPDISIYLYSANVNLRDTVFCEVKRIGAPSEIHLTEEQLNWFLKLNSMGFNSYITNNPIFFKDVVLKEIKSNFIKV